MSAGAYAYVGETPSLVTTSNVIAASVFVLYDHIITFGDEVNLIWRQELTWVSALFYFNRYLTVGIRLAHLAFCSNVFGVVRLLPSDCVIWQWFQIITGQLLFLDVEILLIARVVAYYGRKKALLAFLLLLLIGNLAAIVAMVATSMPQAQFIPNDRPLFHAGSCIGSSLPVKFSTFWILPLATHSVVAIFTIIKYLKNKMDQTPSPPLLKIFVRDHTWAFVTIFAVSLWTMLAWHFPAPNSQIAVTWNYSVLGLCGSRLILNLREAARRGHVTDPSYATSDVKFVGLAGSVFESSADTIFTIESEANK